MPWARAPGIACTRSPSSDPRAPSLFTLTSTSTSRSKSPGPLKRVAGDGRREEQGEGRALSDLARHLDASAVGFRQPAGDVEVQAEAAVRARRDRPAEAAEDGLQPVGGHADALVRDREH